MVWGGGGSWVGFAGTVQVRDGLEQLSLCLLQQPVDVLGAVLGQGCPLLFPVSLCSLERGSRAGVRAPARDLLSSANQPLPRATGAKNKNFAEIELLLLGVKHVPVA